MWPLFGFLLFVVMVIEFFRIDNNTITTRKKVEEIEAQLKQLTDKSKKESK